MARTIVHFVDSPVFGGTEQALLHLLAGLDRNRWRPVLFHHPEPGIMPLLEEARRLSVETKVVPRMEGKKTLSGLPQFIWQLRLQNPAIFHAHLSWLLSCKYGLIAAALTRVPAVIATAQQLMVPPWRKEIEVQQRAVGNLVNRYIAVSDAVARQLNETFGVASFKIRVIRNSIPVDLFAQQRNRPFSMDTERPVVTTVARLDRQKGHTYLLQAIRQIPQAIFQLVGDGPEQGMLEAMARELGVLDRVRFMGYRNDIPALLADSDLFVLPSLYEGLPLSVLEAMAAGKAVVATAVGGTPEAVVDGKTGFLVPPKDPDSLASAIRKVLHSPHLAQEMGAAGRVRARQEFSAATMVERVTDVYEEALLRYYKM